MYRYMGVSVVDSNNGIQSLIGLPSSVSSAGGESSGLSDYFWSNHAEAASFGLFRGGATDNTTGAGALSYPTNRTLADIDARVGFRSLLNSR
ncbi:MAG: hypothetical protein IKC79_00600 [Clostridia bacterium]|nr:hypothetical protein [Clostridia bacterium]